ncbi:L-histidine N(alpha)-methyltransferase [Yoonia sp. BS5-3]|uniref:L-histidine N(Alpha)-methyltransferase n=1 Tax=Yoonia phaeophyticola TaxID=3137369 RepID=A0ABZ2V6C7_9RHOB
MDKPVIEDKTLYREALAGLQGSPKTLQSKWFYDRTGSDLFEQITTLPEYYPTRTETAILREQAGALAAYVQPGAALVELGSGASTKTRILLDHFDRLSAYVPVDISGDFLQQTAQGLARDYPQFQIIPVEGDFMGEVSLPAALGGVPKLAFFPGSTLGNLDPDAATDLLARVRRWDTISAFIIGIDLVKDTDMLIAAYDDAAGVTAAFNLNILKRLNRDIGADFDLAQFVHAARWNAAESRIEMHLVSKIAQTVMIGGQQIRFAEGESIHTENCRKYTADSFRAMAAKAGWQLDSFHTDKGRLFGVCALVP